MSADGLQELGADEERHVESLCSAEHDGAGVTNGHSNLVFYGLRVGGQISGEGKREEQSFKSFTLSSQKPYCIL